MGAIFQQSVNRQFLQSGNKQRSSLPPLVLYDSQLLMIAGFDPGTLLAKLTAASFGPLQTYIAQRLASQNPPLNPPGQPRAVQEDGWYADTYDFASNLVTRVENESLNFGALNSIVGSEGGAAFFINPAFFDDTLNLGNNPFVLGQLGDFAGQFSFLFEDIANHPGQITSYTRWVGRRSRVRYNTTPGRMWLGQCGVHYVPGPFPQNPVFQKAYVLTGLSYVSELNLPPDQWYEIPLPASGNACFIVLDESPAHWSARTGRALANLPAF